MSIIQPTLLSSRVAGHIRPVGPYSNSYRASAPMWTHQEIYDRKSESNHTWPLDFVRDGLIAYMNANDSESLISSARSDGYGFSQAALDQLADGTATALNGFPLMDFRSIVSPTHDHRANRLYVFGESANSASVTTNTDSGANNGKSLYINGNGNYCAGLAPTYHDSAAFPTAADQVKNITITGFVKAYLNDGGAFLKLGWFGWPDHPSRPDGNPDGIAVGIGSGSNTTNVFASNGNRVVARYCGVTGGNLNTSTNWDSGWQMVTLTVDSSSTARVYKNTTLAGTLSSVTPVAPSYWAYIGRNAGDGEHVTQMNIGIFLCYNKALSSNEITQNYNTFKGFYGLS